MATKTGDLADTRYEDTDGRELDEVERYYARLQEVEEAARAVEVEACWDEVRVMRCA